MGQNIIPVTVRLQNHAVEEPRVFLDTTIDPTRGADRRLPQGGNLQVELDSLQPGETLEIDPGAAAAVDAVLR